MKISGVSFREAVGVNPVSGFGSDRAAFELHAAGVLITPKSGPRLLVPFANVKAIMLADEPKAK